MGIVILFMEIEEKKKNQWTTIYEVYLKLYWIKKQYNPIFIACILHIVRKKTNF